MIETDPDYQYCPTCKKRSPMYYGCTHAFWRCDHHVPQGETCYEFTASCITCGREIERSRGDCDTLTRRTPLKNLLTFWRNL